MWSPKHILNTNVSGSDKIGCFAINSKTDFFSHKYKAIEYTIIFYSDNWPVSSSLLSAGCFSKPSGKQYKLSGTLMEFLATRKWLCMAVQLCGVSFEPLMVHSWYNSFLI